MNMSDDLFYYSSELAWRAANPLNFTTSNGNFTTNNKTLILAALTLCAPLNGSSLTAQCSSFISPADVYQACLDDIIATGDYSFGASNVDAYADKCSAFASAENKTISTLLSFSFSLLFSTFFRFLFFFLPLFFFFFFPLLFFLQGLKPFFRLAHFIVRIRVFFFHFFFFSFLTASAGGVTGEQLPHLPCRPACLLAYLSYARLGLTYLIR